MTLPRVFALSPNIFHRQLARWFFVAGIRQPFVLPRPGARNHRPASVSTSSCAACTGRSRPSANGSAQQQSLAGLNYSVRRMCQNRNRSQWLVS